ncbi:MAG: hypothetical protein AAF557_21775 [Pseudomonadota bacterium]
MGTAALIATNIIVEEIDLEITSEVDLVRFRTLAARTLRAAGVYHMSWSVVRTTFEYDAIYTDYKIAGDLFYEAYMSVFEYKRKYGDAEYTDIGLDFDKFDNFLRDRFNLIYLLYNDTSQASNFCLDTILRQPTSEDMYRILDCGKIIGLFSEEPELIEIYEEKISENLLDDDAYPWFYCQILQVIALSNDRVANVEFQRRIFTKYRHGLERLSDIEGLTGEHCSNVLSIMERTSR